MNRTLVSLRASAGAIFIVGLLLVTPNDAKALGIGICGVNAQCGITLINAAASGTGSASGEYTSGTGLVAGPSSGDGTLVPGSLGLGLTAGTITATTGASTGVATANLADGTVRAKANATSGQLLNDSGTAESYDLLHWTVAGGPALITLNAHVDGTIAPSGGTYSDVFSLVFTSGVAGSSPSMQYTGDNSGFGPSSSGGVSTGGWQSFSFSNESATGFDFTGTFLVVNGESQQFFDELAVNCGLGAQCDFLNTGKISLAPLPGGVSFTSDSTVFLTAGNTSPAASAVPEPSTFALLGASLAFCALYRRRQTHRQ